MMTQRSYAVRLVILFALLVGLPGVASAGSGARDGQAPPRSKYGDEDKGSGLRGYRPRAAHHGVPGMKVYKPGYTSEKSTRSFEGSVESDRRQRSLSEEEEEEE